MTPTRQQLQSNRERACYSSGDPRDEPTRKAARLEYEAWLGAHRGMTRAEARARAADAVQAKSRHLYNFWVQVHDRAK